MYYTDELTLDAIPPEDDWKPVYWSPMKSTLTLGDEIADFAEAHCTPPRGNKEDFKIAAFQRWLFQHVFELRETDFLFRYKEVFIEIPRKNGKSFLMSLIAIFFLSKGVDGDRIFFAAKDSDQARIMYEEAVRNIDNSSDLSLILETFRNVSKNKLKDIEMKPLASSTKGAHGLAPYISLCDELHTWDSATGTSRKGEEMLSSLLTGSGDRDEKMLISITTAGSNLEGIAYQRYEYAKSISQGAIEDDSFGYFIWEAEEQDDIFDDAILMKANPGINAGYISLEELKKERESAAQLSMGDFLRHHGNQWIRATNDTQFITAFHWDDIVDEEQKSLFELAEAGERPDVALGFDGSWSEDSTGIVGINIETGAMEVLYKWEKDRLNPNWFVDSDEVDLAFRKCFELFNVHKVYLDPSRHWDLVKQWQKSFGKLIVRDIPPNITRMGPLSTQFKVDVVQKNVKHDGNKRFREHVMNAIETARGLPAKQVAHKKIDFLVCAILANGARLESLQQKANSESLSNFYSQL